MIDHPEILHGFEPVGGAGQRLVHAPVEQFISDTDGIVHPNRLNNNNYTNMKNTLALPGMGLAVILLSTVAFAQKAPKPKGTNNTRHIKMKKIENGKTMELDTVLYSNDVFVWNGDTINQVKHIKKFSPSGFDKIHLLT